MSLTDTYKNVESDAIRWLDTARGFMMSARLIWSKLTPLFDDGFPHHSRHAEMFAYSQSFLLLTGFAFENLYRGMLTASGSSWRKALGTREVTRFSNTSQAKQHRTSQTRSNISSSDLRRIYHGQAAILSRKNQAITSMQLKNFSVHSIAPTWTWQLPCLRVSKRNW